MEPALLLESVREDLRTDWIPDALGGADAPWLLSADAYEVEPGGIHSRDLEVHTPHGKRRVFLISLALRLRLHLAVERALRGLEDRVLSSWAFGYRDLTTPYSTEFARHQRALERLTHAHDVVIHTDVQGFFSSVSIDQLLGASWCTEELTQVLGEVCKQTGQALLPGHRWARRLANAVLMSVDKTILIPFIRWQDDYHLFADTLDEGAAALERLETGLNQLGLELNLSKTAVVRKAPATNRELDEATATRSYTSLFRKGVDEGNKRWVRFALARLAANRDPGVVADIASVVHQDAAMLPRAAWYLDSSLPNGSALDAVLQLLDESDDWRLSRLYPLAVRHAELARGLPERIRGCVADHRLPQIRELGSRVDLANGRRAALTNRLSAWARDRGDVRSDLPIVETRL